MSSLDPWVHGLRICRWQRRAPHGTGIPRLPLRTRWKNEPWNRRCVRIHSMQLPTRPAPAARLGTSHAQGRRPIGIVGGGPSAGGTTSPCPPTERSKAREPRGRMPPIVRIPHSAGRLQPYPPLPRRTQGRLCGYASFSLPAKLRAHHHRHRRCCPSSSLQGNTHASQPRSASFRLLSNRRSCQKNLCDRYHHKPSSPGSAERIPWCLPVFGC
mmetsp:Transcript_13845/g.38040  ORF Transcript_13845/g.38040 Transcript_13845/m.38040 type:complete len:213 (+) Transcript_13845:259-897(+)